MSGDPMEETQGDLTFWLLKIRERRPQLRADSAYGLRSREEAGFLPSGHQALWISLAQLHVIAPD